MGRSRLSWHRSFGVLLVLVLTTVAIADATVTWGGGEPTFNSTIAYYGSAAKRLRWLYDGDVNKVHTIGSTVSRILRRLEVAEAEECNTCC